MYYLLVYKSSAFAVNHISHICLPCTESNPVSLLANNGIVGHVTSFGGKMQPFHLSIRRGEYSAKISPSQEKYCRGRLIIFIFSKDFISYQLYHQLDACCLPCAMQWNYYSSSFNFFDVPPILLLEPFDVSCDWKT